MSEYANRSTVRGLPANTYEPDHGRITSAKWLAAMLISAILFSAIPVAHQMHFNLENAPGWARIVLLLAALQAVYVGWMLSAPDWSTAWVVMLVFAGVSAVYAIATAMAIATPPDKAMPLGLGEVRYSARVWCASVLAVMSLCTYLAGRFSTRWHRSFEYETAGRPIVLH
ncbi:MAG: hypothetical protein U1E05_01815 [Patescibacteria group bacterium]|nr:hypothetical protein [Patescibacteria group bacterium]